MMPGPLFRYESRMPLSHPALVQDLRTALTAAGINAASYAGHSFQIGVTTTAASVVS